MARQVARADGVREALIVERQWFMKRWSIPGQPDETLDALRSGAPVLVSSSSLLKAFMRAGLPHRDFCFGGRHFKTQFLLDEHGRLTEQAASDAS